MQLSRRSWCNRCPSVKSNNTSISSTDWLPLETILPQDARAATEQIRKSLGEHLQILSILVENSASAFCRERFRFCRESDLLSPWVICFCRKRFAFAVSDLLLPWVNLLVPKAICFCRKWFTFAISDLLLPSAIAFAVSDSLLPWAIRFCRERLLLPWVIRFCREWFAFAVTVVGIVLES